MARKTLVQIRAEAYQEGFLAGRQAQKMAYDKQDDARKTQLEAMRAVTALVSAAGQSVQALGMVFDNGPRS